MFNSKKLIKSANFKKDYITIFSIFLFILIFVCELVVIIGIPVAMRYTTIYANAEFKHDFVREFDAVSLQANRLKKSKSATIGEVSLILEDLGSLSNLWQENSKYLEPEQIAEMLESVRAYSSMLKKLSAPEAKTYLNYKEIDFELLKKNVKNIKEQ